ncbi:MAG: alkaline phosphatase D [Maribacter sp.]|jgi:alkaline phosphatase D
MFMKIYLDVDAIIHLGDYIYENGGAGTGGSVGGRTHEPDHKIIDIKDYRIRYSQHKLDFQLQRMYQLMPLIAT